MKDFNYYGQVDVPYPERDRFKAFFVYSRGKIVCDGVTGETLLATAAEHFPDEAQKLTRLGAAVRLFKSNGYIVEEVLDDDGYRAEESRWSEAKRAKQAEFKADLFQDYGVQGNPKAELAYEQAWDAGHSEGFGAVHDRFGDLAPLIEPSSQERELVEAAKQVFEHLDAEAAVPPVVVARLKAAIFGA